MSFKRKIEDTQIKQRNFVAKNNKHRGGAHIKSHKAQRTAVRKNIRCEIEDLLDDEFDLETATR